MSEDKNIDKGLHLTLKKLEEMSPEEKDEHIQRQNDCIDYNLARIQKLEQLLADVMVTVTEIPGFIAIARLVKKFEGLND